MTAEPQVQEKQLGIECAEQLTWARQLNDQIVRYRGEYVALADGRIVGHDKDYLALVSGLESVWRPEQLYVISVPAGDHLVL